MSNNPSGLDFEERPIQAKGTYKIDETMKE